MSLRSSVRTVRVPHEDGATRPSIIVWESTAACTLACRHCRAEAQPERDPAELSTAEAAELMRQAAAFGRPAPLFVISGGDPFQRPDLGVLVRAGTSAGLRVAVAAPGTPGLTPPSVRELHAAGAAVLSLSLDGSVPELHDWLHGAGGGYQRTLAAWQAAREIGLRVQVSTAVTGHSVLDLPDIARLAAARGALAWTAFLLVPTGRGRVLPPLTATEVEDVLNFVYDTGAVIPATAAEAPHFRRIVIQRRILAGRGDDHVRVLGLRPLYQRLRRRLQEPGSGGELRQDGPGIGGRRARRPPMDVNAGRGFVFVAHDGAVYPSGFLPRAAGNVREQPLTSIYRDSPLLAGLRDPGRLGGRCGSCEFRSVCGGSRSRAFAMTGDPHAEEPWCSYQPGSFPYQQDLREYLPAS